MVYWKPLEYRCLESIAANPPCLSIASDVLGPVQLSRLVSYLAAHDLINVDEHYFTSIVKGVLCEEIRGIDLDGVNVTDSFLCAVAEKCGESLDAVRLSCLFKVMDDGLSVLIESLRNVRYLDLRELKIERTSGVLSLLRSSRLESVFLQLYVRNDDWNEVENLVEQNRNIRSLRFSVRGRTLCHEDGLLLKIADHLRTLVELDLHNFQCEKGSLCYLLLSCRELKKLRLTGSMQFDVDTMVRVRQICVWETLDLTFQVTPPRETYDALQFLPPTITELFYKFGPSNRAMIVSSVCSVPSLKRLRYHTEFFNDVLMYNLLSALSEVVRAGLEYLDVGLCDTLTDTGLDTVAELCPNVKELYLHSDSNKYNRVVTAMPLCKLFDYPTNAIEGSSIRVLYFNYFKALSSDYLQMVAAECENLEELHVASVRSVSDQILKRFAANCKQLHTVDIMSCWSVTDRGVVALAERLPLVNLNIAMCFKLTDVCVVALANNCPRLQRFIYHGVPKIKRSPALAQLSSACEKRVKTYLYQWFS